MLGKSEVKHPPHKLRNRFQNIHIMLIASRIHKDWNRLWSCYRSTLPDVSQATICILEICPFQRVHKGGRKLVCPSPANRSINTLRDRKQADLRRSDPGLSCQRAAPSAWVSCYPVLLGQYSRPVLKTSMNFTCYLFSKSVAFSSYSVSLCFLNI